MTETTVSLSDMLATDHSLEFIERQMFYEYDAAYRAYVLDDMPYEQEVRAYEDALNAITHIRRQLDDARTDGMQAAADTMDIAF